MRSFLSVGKSRTQTLVLMALFIAMNIVLSRFLSIAAWNIKIGFAFLPIVLSAMLLGPVHAAIVAACGDFLGAMLFPIASFFPGFTLTAFITGIIYGVFLRKRAALKNIVPAVVLTELLCSLLLNTLWISLLYGAPFFALLPARAFQALIMAVVEIVVIRMIAVYMPNILRSA